MTNYLDVNETKVEIMKIISNYEVKNDDDLLNMCSECYAFVHSKYCEKEEEKKYGEDEWRRRRYDNWGFGD